jgi:arabinofuranan 3-O-arabinosyltransferase
MRWGRNTLRACAQKWHYITLAAVAYIPMFLTQPGRVSADTKTYLFLNPGELLSEAPSLWSSSFGAGTVTHQYIGYLWPMGPYFWIMDTIGFPDWLAQRFWWGSLIFLASLGTHRLARALGFHQNFALITALMYALSPYGLHYLARLSGILLPWVGFPWLLLCLVRRRQQPSWKWLARAVLIIGTIGTVNATTLFFIILGLAIWLTADALSGFSRWRDSAKTFFLLGIGSVGISLWWLTSLVMQSAYGLPILRYSETYETVAKASLPQELLRGLGYWFFYGDEYAGRWIGPSAPYMHHGVVIAAGFVLVASGLISLSATRIPYRIHLSLLTLIGLGIAVGASPLSDSSLYGRLFDVVVNNESGFALRSTPRALPLVLLALALATGWGLQVLFTTTHNSRISKSPLGGKTFSRILVGIILAAIVVNNFPWFTQRAMTDIISRDENLPTYWTDAARVIDAQRDDSTGFGRTYEFPAANFADYWWGGTVDPVLPGLIASEYVAKEMIPQGSEATTDLLSAFESKLVDGRPDMEVLGELAAILSANTVTWRGDIAYDHHLTARPEYLAPSLARTPPGPSLFTGPVITTSERAAIVDETWFGNTLTPEYPLLQVWKVPHARPLLSYTHPNNVVTVVGSGEGVVNALSANVLSSKDTFVYAGTRQYLPRTLQQFPISQLIVTDTNRSAQRQWSSIAQQTGRTERIDEFTSPPSARVPTDQRLNPFTDNYRMAVPLEQMTTSRLVGDVARVQASSYGHPVVLTPEARPENAVDNDPRTSWVVGVRARAVGEWIGIDFRNPVTATSMNVDLSSRQPGGRIIENALLELQDATGATLASVPFTPGVNDSVTVRFPSTTFTSAKVTIIEESLSQLVDYSTAPGIAIGEITFPGIRSSEYIVLPATSSALFSHAQHSIMVLTRQSVDPSIPHRSDMELNLQRVLTLPTAQTFTLTGAARLAGRASERILSNVTNLNLATSSHHMFGSARSIASLAIDGDRTTAWTTPLDQTVGSQILFTLNPISSDPLLRLHVRDDRFHSVPQRVTVVDASDNVFPLELTGKDGVLTAPLDAAIQFPLQSLSIDEVRSRTFRNYFTRAPRELPVSITEIDLGTNHPLRVPSIDSQCRTDLLEVNDQPVPVRVIPRGDIFDTSQNFRVEACQTITLQAGENYLRTAKGLDVGLDVDQLVLTGTTTSTHESVYTPVVVTSQERTRLSARVTADSPQIVSFGQSVNHGWKATLKTADSSIDLGPPFVVQGYANGWLVPEPGELILEWTPQRWVMGSMILSLLCVFGFIFLALWRPRLLTVQSTNENPLRLRPSSRVAIALYVGLVVAFAGVLPALISVVLLFWSRRFSAYAIGLLVALIAGVIIVQQTRYGYPATLDWPLRFADLTPLTWAAVAVACINPLLRRN